MDHDHTDTIPDALIAALRDARHIAVMTGAGISAESGLATFRTESADIRKDFGENPPLWSRFNPMELATPEAYARDPAMVSHWYDWRRAQGARATPNPGHTALTALKKWARSRGAAFDLLTQNIDGLHQAAGCDDVVELHGSLWQWRCTSCGAESEDRDVPFSEYPPKCPSCTTGIRRPGIVWFGEMLPAHAVAAAEHAAASCDLFISVGTSAVVYPAAGFAQAAKARGARVAEVNLEPTPLSRLVDWSLRGRSGVLLPAIARAAGAA